MVAYTKNGDPIYQEIRPNVMVIGAYSGTGNILGTIYGKKAANWAIKKLQGRSKL